MGNSASQSRLTGYNVENGSNNSDALNQIRSQSIDLKIPLNIPGVTSSDSYLRMSQIDQENRKLKKKMKEKLKTKKNVQLDSETGKPGKKKSKLNEYDDDEGEDEQTPAVKVREYEMPEGAKIDSDDDKNMDANDPHRALDINLDE